MHKENEIFRNYEIEEFIFDDCIKEQVKELMIDIEVIFV